MCFRRRTVASKRYHVQMYTTTEKDEPVSLLDNLHYLQVHSNVAVVNLFSNVRAALK